MRLSRAPPKLPVCRVTAFHILLFSFTGLSACLLFTNVHNFKLPAFTALPPRDPQPTPFNLSQTPYYARNYVPPTSDHPAYEPSQVVAHLYQELKQAVSAEASLPSQSTIRITSGVTIDPGLQQHGYIHNDTVINPLCMGRLFGRVPASSANTTKPPCLSVLHNAYFGSSGSAIQPHSQTVFEIAGGCCVFDWKKYLLKTVALTPDQLATRRTNHGKIVLVLSFHHSGTFYHVMHEQLPRYLSLAPLLEAVPEMLVALDESKVSPRVLSLLGLDPKRIIQLPGVHRAYWTFASVLLFPRPHHDHEHEGYYPLDDRESAAILRGAVLGVSQVRLGPRKTLVLMERAVSRDKSGKCHQERCLANFAEFKAALVEAFRKHEVKVFGARDITATAIQLFSEADIVVGMHGAGFQNIMFCRAGVSVVRIGWKRKYDPYANLSGKMGFFYHLFEMKGLERASSNVVLDVDKVVSDIKKAVSEDGKT